MKPQIISSQDYLDPDIVETKRREKDFDVLLSPEFDYEGRTFQIVLDGHHGILGVEAAPFRRRRKRRPVLGCIHVLGVVVSKS